MSMENLSFGWDDEISYDSLPQRNFVTLEQGTYDAKITKFERIQWSGSTKIPKGTNTARLTFEVTVADGVAVFTSDLPLWRTVEWQVSQMFVCFGLRKHGDKNKRMPWGELVGSTGRVVVKKKEWTGNDGQPRYGNEIEKYLDPVPAVNESNEFVF